MNMIIADLERLADEAQTNADQANNPASSVLWAQIAATLRQAAQQATVAIDCTIAANDMIDTADAATLVDAIHGA